MKATNKLLGIIAFGLVFGLFLTGCDSPTGGGTTTYTVTFVNEGTTVATETVNKGDKVTEPQNVTKSGHTLDGWYTEDTFATKWNFAEDTVTGDTTLYAKWMPAGATDNECDCPNGTVHTDAECACDAEDCTCTYEPAAVPTSIEVTTEPTKTLYKVGEQLDLDGIEVTATFSDDSEDEVEITSDDISGFNPNTAGKQTVTVTYAELTDTFDVWVLAFSKIEAAIEPGLEHILVGQGEELDLDDITVTATWKNEGDEAHIITEEVTITVANISDFAPNTLGKQTVKVTYNGKSDTFDVFVRGVTKIEVTKQPTKTTYKIGEQLDLAGLELTVTFSDGEEETIHGSALANDVTGFNSTTAGEKTVTITYGGQTDTFTVTVILVVTFNPNGGNWDGGTSNKTVAVELNATVTEPSDPTNNSPLAQNHLRGWYTDNGTFTNAFSFDTPITDNIELFAEWGYRIGDTGSGGGKIFYRSEDGFTMTDDNSIAYYLEAALNDLDGGFGLRWVAESYGDYENRELFPNIVGTALDIGTGRKNTALILAMDANAPAAKACNEYSNNGKTDWFLPSKDELNELYKSKDSVGGFPTINLRYWSSSEGGSLGSTSPWQQIFTDGYQLRSDYKSTPCLVRAIRAF